MKTVKNIDQTLEMKLPLRVGLIELRTDQNISEAERFLWAGGVERIGKDAIRSVGRGANFHSGVNKPEDALCGACARGKAAVVPNGDVYPCVFSRWLNVGNVLQGDFKEIIAGAMMARRRDLVAAFSTRSRYDCPPDDNCELYECAPDQGPYVCPPLHSCLPVYKPCPPEQYPPCNLDISNPDKL